MRLIRTVGLAALILWFPGIGFSDVETMGEVQAVLLDDLDLFPRQEAADVTEIDVEIIESSGAQSIPELLQNEANVLVRGTTGTGLDGQLSMRGFGENSNLRVLVLVDGHRQNRPDMGGIEWWALPVSDIQHIEVIRGGQNVLYGNHALSGVIKITTRRVTRPGITTGGSMGSHGYLAGNIAAGFWAGPVDFKASLSGFQTDGFRTNSAARGTTLSGSAAWFMNDTDILTLRAMGTDSYLEYPGPLSYAEMLSDPTQSSNQGDQFSDQNFFQSTLLYEAERLDRAGRVSAGVNRRELDASISGLYSDTVQTGLSFEPRYRHGTERTFLMAGFSTFYDELDRDNFRDAAQQQVMSYAELSRITAAPYLFAQKTAGLNLFSGGVRYEYCGTDYKNVAYRPRPGGPVLDPSASFDDDLEKDGWSMELNAVRNFSEHWNFFAGYDRVYRYPTLDETASYQGFPLTDPLNASLEPERGNNFEIGSRYEDHAWTLSLTAFYMTLENEIAFFDNGTERKNINIGSTRRLGFEPEIGWKNKGWGTSTRWTFVDARFDGGIHDGHDVPLVPNAAGTMSVWVNPAEWMRLTLLYTFVSEQFQGNDFSNTQFRKMEEYSLLGFRANFAVSDRTTVTVNVDNLLDETYASAAYSGGFYPGSGRNFRIGLRVGF